MAKRPRIEPGGTLPDWTRPGHALGRRRLLPRQWQRVVVTGLVVLSGAFFAARFDPLPPRFTGEGRASDGDSFRLGSDRIRLVGLDAPELDQTCTRADGSDWPCGREARDLMASILAQGKIACSTEGSDQYGRFLATCIGFDGRDVGARMVEAGFAVSRDLAYASEEADAKNAARGIWQGSFADPRDWRDGLPPDDPDAGLLDGVWTWFRELTGARALR